MPKEIIFPHNTYEVCSKSNFNLKKKKKQSKLGWNFFLNFFWHSRWRCTHNFAELNPLTEGGGKVLFGVASQPPPSFSWRSPVSVRGLPAPSLPLGIRRSLWVPVPVNKAGAQSSGCPWRWSPPPHSWVSTRAWALVENHFCITGLFCLKIFMNLPRASTMKLVLTLASLVT